MLRVVKLSVMAAVLMFSSSTFAVLVSDFKHVGKWLTEGNSHSIVHDLRDNGVPGSFQVTKAWLSVGFSDGYRSGDWALDMAKVTGSGLSGTWEVDGTHRYGYDIRKVRVGNSGIDDLNFDGLLKVTITALNTPSRWDGHNDFWWKTSTLKARIKPKSVPEPSSVALLGLGVLGLSLARKRKK